MEKKERSKSDDEDFSPYWPTATGLVQTNTNFFSFSLYFALRSTRRRCFQGSLYLKNIIFTWWREWKSPCIVLWPVPDGHVISEHMTNTRWAHSRSVVFAKDKKTKTKPLFLPMLHNMTWYRDTLTWSLVRIKSFFKKKRTTGNNSCNYLSYPIMQVKLVFASNIRLEVKNLVLVAFIMACGRKSSGISETAGLQEKKTSIEWQVCGPHR